MERTTYSQVIRLCPDGFWISLSMGTPWPGNLCQYSVPFTATKCFPMFRWHILCFILCLLSLVLSPSTTEKSLAPSLHIFIDMNEIPWAFSSLGWTVSALSDFLYRRDASVQSFHHFCGSSLDTLQYVSCIGELIIGQSTLGGASPVLNKGEGSPLLACDSIFF